MAVVALFLLVTALGPAHHPAWSANQAPSCDAGSVLLSIPDGIVGAPSQSVDVPIELTDVSGKGVLAADVVVTFDPSVLQPASVATGTLTADPDCLLTPNLLVTGQVTISVFCTDEMSGAGSLALITFLVVGSGGSSTPIAVVSAQLNEGNPTVCADGGSLNACGSDTDCDGVDDDCDGTPDDDYLPTATTCGTGACQGSGMLTCAGGIEQDSCVAPVSLGISDGLVTAPGQSLVVPITVSDVTGRGVLSADLAIAFDPGVVQATSVTAGTLTSGPTCLLTPNLLVPGQVSISVFCSTFMTGSGTLAEISLQAAGSGGLSSTLAFSSAFLNEGNPPVCPDAGSVEICGLPGTDSDCDALDDDCSGTADEDYTPVTSCFLPGVCMAGNAASTCVTGSETPCQAGSPSGIAESICNGDDDDCDGAADEGYLPIPTSCGAGACAATGTTTCVDGIEGDTCIPANTTLSLPNGSSTILGETIVVPVQATDLTGMNVISSDLDISYSPSVLRPQHVSAGSLTGDCTLTENLGSPGRVRISIFCTVALSGGGSLAEITFEVIGGFGSASILGFNAAVLNEGVPPTCPVNGSWTVCGTEASESCDGLDNDCDGTVDDGYSVGDSCVLNPGSCALPAHVVCMPNGLSSACVNDTLLDVDHDLLQTTALVRWQSIPGAPSYDVVRGDLSGLTSTAGDFSAATELCVVNDVAATAVADPEVPPPHEGFWYLMRASQCTGGSTYDEGSASQVGSRDPGIQLSGMQCP